MTSPSILCVPAITFAFIACNPDPTTPPTERDDSVAIPESEGPSTVTHDKAADHVPTSAIAESSNAFAMDVYRQLRCKPGNFAFSPTSISTAFAMTYAGARGETAEQMQDTLHFTLPSEELHAAYAEQLAAWNDPARSSYELRVVNRLFGDKSLSLEQPFLDLVATVYGAPLEQLDFVGAPEPARQRINGWVADQTNQRIEDLLPRGSIYSSTRLVLTNAVYFKGQWKTEFEKNATYDGEFYTESGGTVSVPLMHQTADLTYLEVDGAEILEMPYVGDELAMDILLPKSRDGLEDLEAKLDAKTVQSWLRQLDEVDAVDEVYVTLPRFELDTPEPIALAPILGALGMKLPFTASADFTAMGEDLFLDDAYHKAFVEVNEEGTEAAAATAAVMVESAARGTSFVANHPFVFLIRDLQSGSVLFVGRVVDPSV